MTDKCACRSASETSIAVASRLADTLAAQGAAAALDMDAVLQVGDVLQPRLGTGHFHGHHSGGNFLPLFVLKVLQHESTGWGSTFGGTERGTFLP